MCGIDCSSFSDLHSTPTAPDAMTDDDDPGPAAASNGDPGTLIPEPLNEAITTAVHNELVGGRQRVTSGEQVKGPT